ncbi:M56 family metallopeptidase [Streptomyces sp. N2-109]|uniref:M56 family metallopeptidase n=1 Tax=Streptomyces gossypii TaxID=2883101 RepID=A0ABT2JN79_9ACTN|nr:M56 family metallopeptidase [Streptomyces gossypii]MCT2588835.1 M56 family metallopeptidase [Streptomyces gossypii]
MGVFVFLPLVLPVTAWPIVRLAEQHLHPRGAARLLTVVGGLLAVCSTLCLVLLMVVGTAQLPGNPLPDGWSDPEVRAAVPHEKYVGEVSIGALLAVLVAWSLAVAGHFRVRRRAHRSLAGLPDAELAVLPDAAPYAYALPGDSGRRGRVVVSTAMLDHLDADERRVLIAHEQAHLAARHHRFLLLTRLAARANPLLSPLRNAVTYSAERWADEEAAREVGSRRTVARAVAKAALVTRRAHASAPPAFAEPGPVPRRVAALLAPEPPARSWPPTGTAAGLAAWVAAAGTAASALSALIAAAALTAILIAATPL